jgi:hypothetical protein
MLLAIAFLMFAVLLVGWLVSPEQGHETLPAAKPATSPKMSTDAMPSKA